MASFLAFVLSSLARGCLSSGCRGLFGRARGRSEFRRFESVPALSSRIDLLQAEIRGHSFPINVCDTGIEDDGHAEFFVLGSHVDGYGELRRVFVKYLA